MYEQIVIYPWMIQELHLKGAALLVFALWYADRKDRSVKELAQMLGYTEYGIRKALVEVSEVQQSCAIKQLSCENGQESCVSAKERSKENIYSNISTTASTDAHAQAFEWLTKDENWLRILCKNNGLEEQTPLETLQPYIERFIYRLEETGQDIINKGATDTKKHFASWLPKFKLLNIEQNEYSKDFSRRNKCQRQSQHLLDTASALAAGLAAARTGSGLL